MIKEGYKFGCLAINTWVKHEIKKPLKINNNLWFLFSPYKWMLRGWRKYLGRFKIEDFEHTNCIILTTKPAQQIDMLDHDNKTLENTVLNIYYALLLNGVARHSERGFVLTGSNKNGEKAVRSYSPLLAHHRAGNTIAKPVDITTIQYAIDIANILKEIYSVRKKYGRIKKGFRIFIDAMRNQIALERLHQLVRAIEAIVKPKKLRTKRQFVHRCQFFIGRTEEKRNVLSEIYDLRSREEHLQNVDDVLIKYGKQNIDKMIYLRAFQTEIIAEKAYLKILKSHNLRKYFMNDDNIEKHWQEHERILKDLWGISIDINAIISQRSGFYLRTD